MLSRSAVIILALIEQHPLNAYEIIKMLRHMNVSKWYNIADSTVYAALKVMEKRKYISGSIQKEGNMPEKTVYYITQSGKDEVIKTLSHYITDFDYDTIPFSIAGFFITILKKEDAMDLLERRLELLKKISLGISEELRKSGPNTIPSITISNIKRSKFIVDADLKGSILLLETVKSMKIW